MKQFKLSPQFDGKESFTAADVQAIISDAIKFGQSEFKDYVSPEAHNKLVEELKPYKASERKSKINSLVGNLTDEDKLADAIALAGLTDEDDDNAITTKVSEVIKARQWLQKAQVQDPAAAKVTTTTVEAGKKPEETKKDYKFMKNS